MQNDHVKHSAEGSTWTKKNHKYIRKEGNRYIYPSDLKRISQQHANRQNAKNGKLINPTATYRDENGNVALRLHTKGAFATPNQADYKQYSKEMSNQAKQKRVAGNNSQERFGKEGYGFSGNQPSQQSAKWRSNRHKEDSIAEQNAKRHGEYARRNHKQAKALNKQGSVNRQQEAKDFKEYQDWEKADIKKRDSEPKRKAALNKQGSKSYKYESELYGIRDKDNLSGVRDQVSQQDAKEMSKIHRNTSFQKNLRESNKENNNKMYKLKNRVTKAISNLKNKKKGKVDNSQEEYYNGKATKNTLKNDIDDTYDSLINNAKTKNERKKWQKEKGRLIGTRHYTNEHGVEYDEDVYTNSKAASRGEKRLNWTDRGDGHPINSWDKRGKIVQVAVKDGSDGGGWNVDDVTPENVKAKNYYNRKRKKN